MPEDESPRGPLDYETPPRPGRGRAVRHCLGGAAVGIAIVVVIGCFGSLSIMPFPGTQGRANWRARAAAVWIAVALLAGLSAVPVFKRRRPFAAGLLIGMAVTALCEGICYTPQ
jgi:hypothetical protein